MHVTDGANGTVALGLDSHRAMLPFHDGFRCRCAIFQLRTVNGLRMASTTFLATFGLIGLRLIELYGIEPCRFARQLGVKSIVVPDAKTRLSTDLIDAAFASAIAQIPDPAFALRSAECWHPSNLGALGYAWLSSRSLRTALKRLARFSKISGEDPRAKGRLPQPGRA
jgi:hypothetical protein